MYHIIRVVKNICTALILLLHVYTAWRSTDLADHLVFCLKTNSCYLYYSNIIFPHMVSAETIFFLNLEIQRSQYIKVQKLFKGGNYMRKYGKLDYSDLSTQLTRSYEKNYQAFCGSIVLVAQLKT